MKKSIVGVVILRAAVVLELICVKTVVNILVFALVVSARVDEVTVVTSALEFAAAVPRFVDVVFDAWIDALTDVIIGVMHAIRAGILDDVNVDSFAAVMAVLEFSISTPLGDFCCWAAFDCRLMAALDCDRVLQACMPSYHVC